MIKSPFFYTAPLTGRADLVLAKVSSENPETSMSRSRAAQLVRKGSVYRNNERVAKPSEEIKKGDELVLRLEPRSSEVSPPANSGVKLEESALLFEDDHVLVINKPAGLTVHHGSGTQGQLTLVDLIAGKISRKADFASDRPGIVHRLDKGTSGVMVVAKNRIALDRLSKQFAARIVLKQYDAFLESTPRRQHQFALNDSGILNQPIGRDERNRTKMNVRADGRPAFTSWEVVCRTPSIIHITCFLKTGRTHQIRVHCAHAGAPIVGDTTYQEQSVLPKSLKNKVQDLKRIALHASVLSFYHPYTSVPMAFRAPIPHELSDLLNPDYS